MSCQYCKFAVSARGSFWPTLVCENEFGAEGLWRQVDFGGACENFASHESGFLGGGGLVRYIPLTRGQVAIVDAGDYPSLIRYKWYATKSDPTFYAATNMNKRSTPMHRAIMEPPMGMVVDHINHNGLDNRRSNLRICTSSQNSRNRRPDREKQVKYKGVSFHKRDKTFRATIQYQNKALTIGCYQDEIAAAKAYDRKAKELFGEYAYLNFPVSKPARKKSKIKNQNAK